MRARVLTAVCLAAAALVPAATARPDPPRVLRVGTYRGVRGQFRTIQAAVRAAHRGDWILVAPGDYHEQGMHGEPAGVLIHSPGIRLRGMDRNRVIVDGTKPGARPCSSRPRDQEVRRGGRDGIEVLKANGVHIENLTVCNYLTNAAAIQSNDTAVAEGNEIWWNGGDGSGRIGMRSWWGDYLTATSTFSRGVRTPYGNYGIFVSNSRGPGRVDHSYASNMGDAAFYVGACPDCNAVIAHSHAENSALGFSGSNAGGHLIIERTEFDRNKAGPTIDSLNNDDAPSPQDGACPHGGRGPRRDGICTVWRDNLIHDNNNPNVPGNGASGIAGVIPVGTGVVLGGDNTELFRNRIYDNDAWGVAVADFPDQEGPNPLAHCRGGTYLVPPPAQQTLCYYQTFGNVIADNAFRHNGGYRNPTNGDIVLYAQPHAPGNCFRRNRDPHGLSSDPATIQAAPYNPCRQTNGNTDAAAFAQLTCALKLAPCPPGTRYPQPRRRFRLHMPPPQPTMRNPCAGVPANPWCP